MARKKMSPQEMNTYKMLGKNVAILREERGLTQSELAKMMGVSQGLVSAIEHGRVQVTYTTLHKLLSALDVTYEDLTAKRKYIRAQIDLPAGYVEWLREFELSGKSIPKKLLFIIKELTNPENIVSFVQEELSGSVQVPDDDDAGPEDLLLSGQCSEVSQT